MVHRIALEKGDLRAGILTRGAILQELTFAPRPQSLVLGAPDLPPYEGPLAYFGAIVGPVANRISGGRARIDANVYDFDANQAGRHTLHGGFTGLHARIWEVVSHAPDRVTLALDLPDGTDGFPGARRIRAEYRLTAEATLDLTIEAETDATTLMNLAHHAFWNLDGAPDWAGHSLQIAAEHYLPVDAETLPTGEIAAVAGTPYDFRTTRQIRPGEAPPLDHNFCLASGRREMTEVLVLTGRDGVRMTLSTTEPGLQVFDSAPTDTQPHEGHLGVPYGPGCGFAIEPQGWPDAPNRPEFPSVRLDPGQTYRQHTRYAFSLRD
ncbi:galactose mutarotase [Mesobaculum littorinae]|uniref:Galactose mutarotase n=2 Tax=Mesobaculum littorinae TaxID=2486419 RepID=A0A438AK62_9RHOB|nr:galactose mutarotase [Mesobaculum littorinae]